MTAVSFSEGPDADSEVAALSLNYETLLLLCTCLFPRSDFPLEVEYPVTATRKMEIQEKL